MNVVKKSMDSSVKGKASIVFPSSHVEEGSEVLSDKREGLTASGRNISIRTDRNRFNVIIKNVRELIKRKAVEKRM